MSNEAPRQSPRSRPGRRRGTSSPLELSGYAPPVRMGSNRGFGIFLTVVLAVIGLFPLLRGEAPTAWFLAASGAALAVALARAEWLSPLNKAWFWFGMILHRIVSPVVMGLIYILAVTPTGLVLRAVRKDILRLRRDPDADSYWIPREPPGPSPESMKDQH